MVSPGERWRGLSSGGRSLDRAGAAAAAAVVGRVAAQADTGEAAAAAPPRARR